MNNHHSETDVLERTAELEKELAAKNHELEIEAALEKVRAKTMVMHKSGDLLEVIPVLAEQFQLLGFNVHSTNVNTDYHDRDWHLWICNPGYTTYPDQLHIPYFDHPYFNRTLESLARGSDFNSFVFTKEEKDIYLDHVYANTAAKNASEERKKFTYDAPGFAWSVVYLKNTALTIANYDARPYTEEQNVILRRFGNVFEQTFTRFLDLQKAEAQARETQIEAALEKVRSRSLAMHKSEELQQVVAVAFERLRELNISMDAANIDIFSQSTRDADLWIASPGQEYASCFHLPYVDYIIPSSIFNAKEKGDGFFAKTFSFEEKNKYFNYLFEHSDFKHLPESRKNTMLAAAAYTVSFAFTKSAAISIHNYSDKSFSDEENNILKRFARVFEQAYTRFLDLQKAEAQAREARIEASLERVRGKAMAMHNSEDLAATIRMFYQELVGLSSVPIIRCGAGLLTMENYICDLSSVSKTAGGDLMEVRGKLDMEGSPMLKECYENWLIQKECSYVLHGNEIKKHYQYMRGQVSIPDYPDDAVQYFYFPMFNEGSFYLVTENELSDEDMQTYRRFISVLSLTYKRYNDLRQAEAQAREAQIQLALERVRARTMAMQKSDELPETAAILFEQFKSLGQELMQMTIGIVNEAAGVIEFSVTDWSGSGAGVNRAFNLSIEEPSLIKKMYAGWKENKRSLVVDLTGKELENWISYRNKMSGVTVNSADTGGRRVITSAFFSKGHLSVSTPVLPVTESIQLLERFAQVFDLTYTRFLDLQKAEAQARESQIQLALERVRARTMAMQKSDELAEAARVLYEEFRTLNINTFLCGYCFYKEEQDKQTVWVTFPDGTIIPDFIDFPITGDHILNKRYEDWKEKKPLHVLEMQGEENKEHHRFLASKVSDQAANEIFAQIPHRIIVYCANFSTGYLFIIATELLTGEEEDVIIRFAKVFELTYTRFNDLKQAEAQARESQIQLALERVRARTMAMQKSDELMEASNLLLQQVQSLGIPVWACGYNIWEIGEKVCTAWMSVLGAIQPSFRLPLTEHRTFIHMYESRLKAEPFYVEEVSGEELEDHYRYMFSLPDFKEIATKQLQGGSFPLPQSQTHHVFNFKHGNLIFLSAEAIPEARDIFKRFTAVFEQTYIRFLDLQKAEAQVRESEIELALERVRAKTMAMQKPSEFGDVINVIGEQFVHLAFDIEWVNFGANGLDISNGIDIWNFAVIPGLYRSAERVFIPYFDHPVFTLGINQFEKFRNTGEDFYEILLDKKDKDSWLDHLFTKTIYKDVSDELKTIQYPKSNYVSSNITLKDTWLSIGKYGSRPFTDEQNAILRRFANAFGQAYTRFLDLQKAEAQAREAQIEASLERVRASAMAMHRSDELSNVLAILFEQFDVLKIQPVDVHLDLFDLEKNTFSYRATGKEGKRVIAEQIVDLDSRPEWQALLQKWKKGKPNTVDFSYYPKEVIRELMAFFPDIWAAMPGDAIMSPEDFPDGIFDALGFCKFGYIGFHHHRKATEEEQKILIRFANEFERLYQRFLDLQKAEAQAREAQIELGLERVRAKAMAMQRSEELKELIGTVFTELTKLDIVLTRCLIMIFDPKTKDTTWWMANSEAPSDPIGLIVQYHELPGYLAYVKAWQEKQLKWQYILEGATKKEWDDFLFVETELSHLPDFVIAGMKAPDRVYLNASFNSFGNLTLATLETLSEEHFDIMLRFAKVFDLTYTRFNDLKQAEAQAREAQIEAALERVRSRTMGMQKSDELKDVIQVVYKQFVHLNIHVEHTGFIMDYKERNDMHIWLADKHAVPLQVTIPYFDCAHWNSFNEAKEKGIDFFANKLSFEEKNKFYQDLFKLIPGLPEETLKYYFSCPGLAISTVLLENIGLYIENFSGSSYSDEENNTLMRFGKVFQQTYTRFLDLQKAEAQAREARIETALEKVRSRTMAMQRSAELAEVATVLFQQVKALGVPQWTCGFGIFEIDDKEFTWYPGSADGDILPPAKIPLTEHPVFISFNDSRKRGDELFIYEKEGEYQAGHYRYMQSLPGMGGLLQKMLDSGFTFPTFQIDHVANFSHGNLVFITYEPFPEMHDVFKRFAKVFDQTYTRFLDLQKAEAQAREATKRATVDRVRAEIASMRTTNDLERITPLIWNELTTLGVPFIRCGVFIMDEEKQLVETHLSTPDGKAIASFTSTFSGTKLLTEILPYWQRKEVYKAHWDEAMFLEQAKSLVEQGSITSGEKYLTENRPTDLYLHFLPFLQGMLYAGNTSPLNDDALQLMQNLADAFSTAYARYEDFNKLEVAKEQIEKTLVDLKQAQQQLVQSEKMASLGELTAGIAHEIQNPLNFVNNFSDVNKELLEELKEEADKGNIEEIKAIANDVINNEEKINHHGKRADAIVKNMLQHSRSSGATKELTDINKLADEYLRLSYHGLRAKDKSFNADFKTELDEGVGKINVIPQDIGRVLLNLFNNAFYATNEKTKRHVEGYEPTISVSTKKINGKVEIIVKDNGNGIPQKIVDKIFQPFFTTKPTGQGTGLGLSLSYDIIKAHGGEIKVETKEGEGSEFEIQLPV